MLQGVKERDRLVFIVSEVRSREIPIVMVTSGGYQVFIIVSIVSVSTTCRYTHTHTAHTSVVLVRLQEFSVSFRGFFG